MRVSLHFWAYLLISTTGPLLGSGCLAGSDPSPGDPPTEDYLLADLDDLLLDAPANADLPSEGKADDVYPATFDLRATQSPVRSQERRGVCSIFSTVGLMEHLYIAEGTITDPDFSEQFLQWSVKTEVGAFQNSSGSNASYNLRAIRDYGIVSEAAWPYEGWTWGAGDDPDCDGEEADRPVKCWTHGNPPAAALDATRFHLPSGRWVNSSADSIKAHMVNNETGVIVGLTFFYQSWNHSRSTLPRNDDYYAQGYVLYPNEADQEISLEKRVGHSILLMGWDDDLEVQTVDGDGNLVVDAQGEPVMERGFFLFKNSWGTTGFGKDNVFGAGYGWISYRYVAEHGSAYVSALPEVTQTGEICGDNIDNDGDGATDCADDECSALPTCSANETTYENNTPLAIPDADETGIQSSITVADTQTIAALSVGVDITHPYRGDLFVALVRDGREAVLLDRAGGGDDDVHQTFVVNDFNGEDASGEWRLVVADKSASDVGTLDRFSLVITRQ